MTPSPYDVIDATWPAASLQTAGGFTVREGRGGGSRVSSASLSVPFAAADIDAAIAAHRALDQQPKFMIRAGDDDLDAALAARGFERFDPVAIYEAPVAALVHPIPHMTALAHWPPLAMTGEVWAAGDIGPARQAVADRARVPKTALLGRVNDRAAGAGYVAIHDSVAMLHALVVRPAFRRLGLARAMMAEAARWAADTGADRFMLVVTEANPANALYAGLGMQITTRYHYRREVTP